MRATMRICYTPKLKATVNLAPELSPESQHGYILDDLATWSLISIGQLCSDGCVALFSKYNLKILKNNKVIITGLRNDNGLWSIPMGTPKLPIPKILPILQANGMIKLDQIEQELAQCISGICFSPASSTLMRAVREKMTSWSGLTTSLIPKHLPKIVETTKGHLDQEANFLQSISSCQD